MEQQNADLSRQLEHANNKRDTRRDKSQGYIEELQKMNELQGKENTILHENK